MKKKVLTVKQKKLIWLMLLGPYQDDWRDSKGIVDNTDKTIAQRLGLKLHLVINFTIEKMDIREVYLFDMRSLGYSEDKIRDKLQKFDNDIENI